MPVLSRISPHGTVLPASEDTSAFDASLAMLRAVLCSLSICAFAAIALADTGAQTAAAGAAGATEGGRDPQVAFNNSCRTCHSPREGDHRLGPSLGGVVGRKAGSIEGYQFSSAMKSSNIVWDEATLDAFIENPDKVVHGNAMKPFGGIDSAEQRGEIIAYLKSVSGK
jgi:cytochrome c